MADRLFDDPDPTIDQQIQELEREIGKRAEAFPRWVKDGKMKQATSDYRMRCMRAALATLVKVKASQQEGR